MRIVLVIVMVLLLTMPTVAAPILDGALDGDNSYGAAKTFQTVQTGFGDNFNELNAAYAVIDNGVLHLMITGNIESNHNRLEIFVDSVPGGQNQLDNNASTPINDGWAAPFAGFTFDSGFTADYMLIARRPNATTFNLDLATIGGGPAAYEQGLNAFGGASVGTNPNALPIAGVGVAYSNGNTAGVGGGAPAAATMASALSATLGLELAIPLSAIGNPAPGTEVRIVAMINGNDHNYLSNQFLPGLPAPQGNLGGDGNGNFNFSVGLINLNNYAGNQYFTVEIPELLVPELSSFALAGMALGSALMRGRLRRDRSPRSR